MNQNKDQMHPEDMRNLLIFFALAITIYFGYDIFVAKPQQEAMKKAQVAKEKIIATQKSGNQDPQLLILPKKEVLTQNKRISFDNGEIFGSISLKGGRLDDVSFHEFYETLERQKNETLLSPVSTRYPRYIEYGWVAADQGIKLPDDQTIWRVSGNQIFDQNKPVTLSWNNGQGFSFERKVSLDEHYMFTVTQRIINNSGRQITLYPYALISQTGLPRNLQKMWIMHEGPMGFIGDELIEHGYNDLEDESQIAYSANQGWTGITDKYWLTALIPAQGQITKYRYNFIQGPPVAKDKPARSRYQIDMMGSAIQIASGNSAEVTTHAFAGAKKVLLLNEYKGQFNIPNFDLAVDFGMFWIMTKPFFYALHFLFELVGNFGIAILLLTLVIRTAVFPLTNLSYVSFAKMKKVAPQMTELREKHGDDRAALQKSIMTLYQKEGVNPMSGCFPILLQIPIFFALYKVLFITIEMRHAPFYG